MKTDNTSSTEFRVGEEYVGGALRNTILVTRIENGRVYYANVVRGRAKKRTFNMSLDDMRKWVARGAAREKLQS